MSIKFIRIIAAIVIFTGLCFVYGCSSSTWDDAQKADSYEAYQTYITDNPEGEHVEEAQKRSDTRYWNSIENDSTAKVFEKYLDKFPKGQFRSEAQTKLNKLSGIATKGRVTGSNVIIRSDHTTESPSAGVVAKEGTVVQILDQFNTGNSNEAILKREVTVTVNGKRLTLVKGKALRILEDRGDSVEASFSSAEFGKAEATISKNDIEAIGGQKWYKIHTTDDITGWVYGKFIEVM
jgi:hypothetical protein